MIQEQNRNRSCLFSCGLTGQGIALTAAVAGFQIALAGEFLKIEAIGATDGLVDGRAYLRTIRFVEGHCGGNNAGHEGQAQTECCQL